MNILSLTNIQLTQLIKLLEIDRRDELITNNYFVNEEKYKILDFYAIQEYFTLNNISNNALLVEIAKKCVDVINLLNIDFLNFKDRTLETPFNYVNEEKGIIINSNYDFTCITSTSEGLKIISDKKLFVENFNYKTYQLAELANKCSQVLKWLSAFNTEIKQMYINQNKTKKEEEPNKKQFSIKRSSKAKTTLERIYNNLSCFNFYQISFTVSNSQQKNNNSFINSNNWNEYKDIFFEQRMDSHNSNYSLDEKIDLEQKIVDSLFISNDEYEIITKRYKNLLKEKKQSDINKQKELGSFCSHEREDAFFMYPVNFHGSKLFTGDSEIKLSNWDEKVDDFFEYRKSQYETGYKIKEIIDLEIKKVNKLNISKEKFEILKNRYTDYLKSYSIDKCGSNQIDEYRPDIVNNSESLADKIETYFAFFLDDCPSKGKPILENKEDFENLIKWTTYFFENKFKVPEIKQPIKKVQTNYYITQLAFQLLFKELKKEGFHNQVNFHKNLFILWESIFSDYKGYKEDNFWKVKRKNPTGRDFDDLVREKMGI